MQEIPLLERYCQQLHLTPEEARRRLFYDCVPKSKRRFVRLHSKLRPQLYACDWRLIHEAGLATNMQGVVDALDRWQHCAPLVRSWGREWFHWRISGRRILAIAEPLFLPGMVAPQPRPVRSTRVAITMPSLGRARETVRQTFEVCAHDWVRVHG